MIKKVYTVYISIPTPARGVTHLTGYTVNRITNFNSHPREGGDTYGQGLDRFWTNFNSHPREGGDVGNAELINREGISIPTPARGVTGCADL